MLFFSVGVLSFVFCCEIRLFELIKIISELILAMLYGTVFLYG